MKRLILILVIIVIGFQVKSQVLFSQDGGLIFKGKPVTDYINVKDFGAKGNGITDDRDAIYNALIAARDGSKKVVYFPTPDVSYKINNGIVINDIIGNITIIGNNSILDFSESVSVNCLTFNGKNGGSYAISDSIRLGDNYIVSDNANQYKKGDLIDVKNTEKLRAVLDEEYNGELVSVDDVSNDTIYLETKVHTYYSPDSTTIRKLEGGKINIYSLEIKGNYSVNQNGIYLYSFKSANVSETQITNTKRSGLSVVNCSNGIVENSIIKDANLSGTGYGIVIGAAQDIIIKNNFIDDCRMGVAIGGSNDGFSRNIYVNNNIVSHSENFGLNAHAGVEYVDFINNTINGSGFFITGRNINVDGNKIFLNKVGDYGVLLSLFRTDLLDCDYVKINSNSIYNQFNLDVNGIYVFGYDSAIINDVKINNNIIDNVTSALIVGVSSDKSSTDSLYVNNLNIMNNNFKDYNLGVKFLNLISDNARLYENFLSGNSLGFWSDLSTIDNLFIHNNIIKTNSTNTRPIYIDDNLISNLFVTNNNLYNSPNTISGQLVLKAIDGLVYENNYLENSLFGGFQINDVDSLWMDDNIFKNVTGSPTKNALWVEKSWDNYSDSIYTKNDLITVGNSSIDFGNIINKNYYKESLDSVYYEANSISYNHEFNTNSIGISGDPEDTMVIRFYVNSPISNGFNLAYINAKVFHYRTSLTNQHKLYDLNVSVGKAGTSTYVSSNSLTELNSANATLLGTFDVNIIFNNNNYFDVELHSKATYTTFVSMSLYSFFNVKSYKMFTK